MGVFPILALPPKRGFRPDRNWQKTKSQKTRTLGTQSGGGAVLTNSIGKVRKEVSDGQTLSIWGRGTDVADRGPSRRRRSETAPSGGLQVGSEQNGNPGKSSMEKPLKGEKEKRGPN